MKLVLTSRNNLFIITAIIVFALSGCSSETTYILTEDELTWMAYENNQVVKFQSSTGLTRTYNVFGRWRGDGNAAVTILLDGDTLANNQGTLDLVKDGSGFNVTVGWPHYPVKLTPTAMLPVTDTISGIILNDIYFSSTLSSDSIKNVRKVYYSKSLGVVQFVESNGVTWSVKN